MARKSAKPQHVEPEDESQDYEREELEATEPDEEEDEPEAGDTHKSQAARAAPLTPAMKARRGGGLHQEDVRDRHEPAALHAIKSQYKKKQGGGKAAAKVEAPAQRSRKPKAEPEGGYLAPPPKPQPTYSQPDLLAAMESMKPLVQQPGQGAGQADRGTAG